MRRGLESAVNVVVLGGSRAELTYIASSFPSAAAQTGLLATTRALCVMRARQGGSSPSIATSFRQNGSG
jgi:hypothetical protein